MNLIFLQNYLFSLKGIKKKNELKFFKNFLKKNKMLKINLFHLFIFIFLYFFNNFKKFNCYFFFLFKFHRFIKQITLNHLNIHIYKKYYYTIILISFFCIRFLFLY